MLTEFVKYLVNSKATGSVPAENSDPHLFPEDMNIVSLESYAAGRYRERMLFNTASIEDFIGYTNKRSMRFCKDSTITTVDEDSFSAKAIFNSLTPDREAGHCDDTAVCTLKELPMWKALMRIGDAGYQSLDQREVVDFIRDWHEHIDGYSPLAGKFQKLTVEGVTNVSSEEKDFGHERSAMEKMDMKADGGEVPGEILVRMIPFDGFEERQIEIGISAVITREKIISLRLRVRGYENLRLSIAKEFAGRLKEGLDVTPLIGTIKPAA